MVTRAFTHTTALTLVTLIAAIPTAVSGEICYLFSHGIAETGQQVHNYVRHSTRNGKLRYNTRFIVGSPYATFNYPDATRQFWRINFWHTSLGQENETTCLKKAHSSLFGGKDEPCGDDEVVIVGVSRGASTALTFTALHTPKRVAALVLESPYDSVESIISHRVRNLGLANTDVTQDMGRAVMQAGFWRYRQSGISPIEAASLIDKNLPILIVCSQEDTVVPAQCSIALYRKLRKCGHNAVHLLVLDKGEHAKIIDQDEGDIYRDTVHAFYKKYHLPHKKEYARAGADYL